MSRGQGRFSVVVADVPAHKQPYSWPWLVVACRNEFLFTTDCKLKAAKHNKDLYGHDASRIYGMPPRWPLQLLHSWFTVLRVTATHLKIEYPYSSSRWWRHQMETFSALLAICAGNSPVPDEFPAQRPMTRSFDVFLDLHPNKRLSKQWWGWWFETSSCPLWRHRNVNI